MSWKIPLADLVFGQEEEAAVLDTLRSGWLTQGPRTEAFEAAVAATLGVRHAVAVANGTAALHLACAALGLGPGDEVILPALTFVATANAIRYTGATPVFADITSLDDLTLSPLAAAACITPRTRAILVMHYAGYPCDMPAFQRLARQHNLALLEDAAHAIGATLEGRALGAWSDTACFSFFSNKNLAVGEGGLLATDRDDLAGQFRTLRSHGMTTLTWDRHRGHASSYDVTTLGYNYRMDEIRAALGIVQLHKLPQHNAARATRTAHYRACLTAHAPQVGQPFTQPRGQSAHHILPILLPEQADRAAIMAHLKAAGIQTSIHYPLVPTFSAYQTEPTATDLARLPHSVAAAARQLTLPLYPTLTETQIETVVAELTAALEKEN